MSGSEAEPHDNICSIVKRKPLSFLAEKDFFETLDRMLGMQGSDTFSQDFIDECLPLSGRHCYTFFDGGLPLVTPPRGGFFRRCNTRP